MSCSLAPKYKWCDSIPSPHFDDDKNRYCIYHAPHGSKDNSSLEHFNKLVLRKIKWDNTKHGASNISGTIFEGDIDFKEFYKKYPESSIDFTDATFNGTADFDGVSFNASVSFKRVRFKGPARFKGATFCEEINFEWAVFEQEADFEGAKFISKSQFFDAQFKGRANFKGADFGKEVYFSIGAFKSWASFDKVKYGARAVFKRPYPGIAQDE
jgi:hypothetical protein